jgi:hypothetical protein
VPILCSTHVWFKDMSSENRGFPEKAIIDIKKKRVDPIGKK